MRYFSILPEGEREGSQEAAERGLHQAEEEGDLPAQDVREVAPQWSPYQHPGKEHGLGAGSIYCFILHELSN